MGVIPIRPNACRARTRVLRVLLFLDMVRYRPRYFLPLFYLVGQSNRQTEGKAQKTGATEFSLTKVAKASSSFMWSLVILPTQKRGSTMRRAGLDWIHRYRRVE